MIGSEGTLDFISRITYRTVAEDPCKASALVFFPDIETACQAVIRLKPQPVSAVELLDRAALRSVEDKAGLPPMQIVSKVNSSPSTYSSQLASGMPRMAAMSVFDTLPPGGLCLGPESCYSKGARK